MLTQSSAFSGPHSATRILVDYFSFSVSVGEFSAESEQNAVYLPDRIESKFFLRGLEFQERKGLYGYAYSRWYDGILYAWGGNGSVFVQMSGTGCRTWETIHPGLTWERWISYLHATYASLHISRLDIACDTFGLLKLRTIQQYTRAGKYISRWKTYLIQEGSSEMSVIWGSSKSDFRLRIYDKTLERTVKGGAEKDRVPKDWVRCEFQLRNAAASSFWRSWQQCGSFYTVLNTMAKTAAAPCRSAGGTGCWEIPVRSLWLTMPAKTTTLILCSVTSFIRPGPACGPTLPLWTVISRR